MSLIHAYLGAFIHPTAYTLTNVTSLNGSPVNGSCPQECVGMVRNTRTCDCTTVPDQNTIGVLIDGVIPTVNTSQSGWASQLFTVYARKHRYVMSIRFGSNIMLREVELYVFHCPAWNIGADTINIYNALTLHRFIRQFNSAGNVILTSDMENCDSITRVSIPLQTTVNIFIEFTNLNGMAI